MAAGAIFLFFDLRGDGRDELAEVAGAAAFAGVPAAFAALAGWRAPAAAALAVLALARSVPTVLYVRALLRAQKTGRRQVTLALAATMLAFVIAFGLVRAGLAPRTTLVLLGVFVLRAGLLLVWPRPQFRARTLGIFEAVLGAAFVFAAAIPWRD